MEFQLSHEELLLLLALLRLPSPLSLGTQPAAGYNEVTLGAALGAALSSLAARDLVSLPERPGTPPLPAPSLAAALRSFVITRRCLLVAGGRGHTSRVSQLGFDDAGNVLLLTADRPGVHRFASLPNRDASIDAIIGTIAAQACGETWPAFRASAAALLAATAAAPTGQAAATAVLVAAELPPALAAAFASQLGPTPGQYALSALRGLDAQPEQRGALILQGVGSTWCANDTGADALLVGAVGPQELRAAVAELLDWLET